MLASAGVSFWVGTKLFDRRMGSYSVDVKFNRQKCKIPNFSSKSRNAALIRTDYRGYMKEGIFASHPSPVTFVTAQSRQSFILGGEFELASAGSKTGSSQPVKKPTDQISRFIFLRGDQRESGILTSSGSVFSGFACSDCFGSFSTIERTLRFRFFSLRSTIPRPLR